jgi:hypothetical protein
MPAPHREHTIIACSDRTPVRAPNDRPSVICFTPGHAAQDRTGRGGHRGPRRGRSAPDAGRRRAGRDLVRPPADVRRASLRAARSAADPPAGKRAGHRPARRGPCRQPRAPGAGGRRDPRDLWGEAEVLVRAGDLVGDRGITVDHSLRETWYIHLMLERHQVVWANGVQVESFHPGFMGLDTLSGPSARKPLRPAPRPCGRSLCLWRARAADAEPGRGGDPVRRRARFPSSPDRASPCPLTAPAASCRSPPSRLTAAGFSFGVGGPRKGMPVGLRPKDNALHSRPRAVFAS